MKQIAQLPLLVISMLLLVSCASDPVSPDNTTPSSQAPSSSALSPSSSAISIASSSSSFFSSSSPGIYSSSGLPSSSSSSIDPIPEYSSMALSSSMASSSAGFAYDTIADHRNPDKKYPIIQIGSQYWMATNMDYHVNDALQYSWKNSLGGYYTWPLADTICPTGTHLASKADWETLIQFAGGDTTALRKLKHSTAYWMDKDYAYYLGTDDYGFGAVGAGRTRVGNGATVIKGDAYFWTSTTEGDSVYTVHFSRNDQLEFIKVHKTSYRQSVRCLK